MTKKFLDGRRQGTKNNISEPSNLGRGKFAEIKEIKEISRKSLKNL